ncbi:antiviral reverse transcriptase Drt3a [Variovorax paradoxus]|uniref:Reverse transcriptase domain-containing protein n=1 Tax=Variovorax paradoxus TaxID=34073 RepID=A0A6I6HPL9_VARPD|nr:antiviral reverse transcriptase Drt3a [Variovorax paradoxus]QGW84765.1 hypothetical protein GOQ09_25725 [Variovorax paradoxus]
MHRIFTLAGFGRVIRAGDSRRFSVDLKNDRESVMEAVVSAATVGDVTFSPHFSSTIKKRKCYSIKTYSHILVLRAIALFLSRRFRINPRGRDSIVKEIIETLSDSTPMHIYRRDISSFYENLPIKIAEDQILYSAFIPTRMRDYIKKFFETFSPGAVGVPRGIGLSTVISELVMRKNDQRIREMEGVYKYFRYSDDILIFSTQSSEQLAAKLATTLPPGLTFNTSKSSEISVTQEKKSLAKQVAIEYLGYKFQFSDHAGDNKPRKITVSISDKKISKLKSKLICIFKNFSTSKDFGLFKDRIQFISSNYFAYRRGVNSLKDSSYVKSGIYYNYHLCGVYQGSIRQPHDCSDLKSLDGFYNSLLAGRSSEFRSLFIGTLGKAQLQVMRRFSFFKGFEHRMTVRFSSERIRDIKKVWRNG